MKKFFTFIFAVATVIYALPVNAQNERNVGQIKPEIRKMDSMEHPTMLRSGAIEMRADQKPFPDSTITYNLKGEQIRKAIYVYDARGNRTSYREYAKKEGTNNWYESSKVITTYNSAGKLLTGESSKWDETTQTWVGDYKYASVYDASGEEISYEEYDWDAQSNAWKGYRKYIYDSQNGNSRTTSYTWDSNKKDWTPDERIEYVSATVRYREYWNSSSNTWGRQVKIESKNIINYNKSDVRITIDEERTVIKDDNGKWDEDNGWTSIRYFCSSLVSWSAWGWSTYDIKYDAGNISSVKLTDSGSDTFTTNFTYDNKVNKANSNKVYDNNELVDSYSCIYDNLGRKIELTRNYNFEGKVQDYKYGYTYIGNSDIISAIEYYLWDSSKKVFVKESKNMYTSNETGTRVMYQTYSWAETKWVLSSYTIYYPNDYTSDLEFEETAPVGSSNKGTFVVGFDLPQDADVTGSFYITFPNGFVLDEENTVLSDALSKKYAITLTKQEKNTWFVEIKDLATRSLSTRSASSFKEILTVAFKVDENTKKGTYKAEITNLNFLLSDGTMLIEQQRDIPITVERNGVANEQFAAEQIKAFVSDALLTIDTPDIESIHVYNINGGLVYSFSKTAGKFVVPVNEWRNGVYIVTGSQGWTMKVWIK